MRTFAGGLALALWAGLAWGADKPVYAPPPNWVVQADAPKPPPADDGQANRWLLVDQQSRFAAEADEFYIETAVRIQAPQGLQAAGNVALTWDPEKETLIVHKLRILRGGQVIDLLGSGQTFTVLRRENNLELAMLDGRLTAAMQPEGLQVGDILDIAVTRRHHDSALPDRSEQLYALPPGTTVDRLRIRALWPRGKSMNWRGTEGLPPVKISKGAAGSELVIDETGIKTPEPPKGAPPRFSAMGELQFSDYASWEDVSAAMAPLYRSAASLAPDSRLKAEAAKIRALSGDPKIRAAAALKLVQEQVRYVYLGMNLGGYVPAKADVTWSRRFGDCKGKTALLIALLNELGIDAQPALVSTSFGDGMSERLPSVLLFDHVIARVTIGGQVYWLDGTRLGDRRLEDLHPPGFRWALPVQAVKGNLETLVEPPFDKPMTVSSLRLDASGGLESAVPAHAELLFRGDAATQVNLQLGAVAKKDLDQFLHDYWAKHYDWITQKSASFTFDDMSGEARLVMDGQAAMEWNSDGSGLGNRYTLSRVVLGWRADFSRDPDTRQDAPYAVPFPLFDEVDETVLLPRKGAGFTVVGGDVDETIAGRRFRRSMQIHDGVLTVAASIQSLRPEFPASEAAAAKARLRQMLETNVYLRAPAGYAASQQELRARTEAQPTSASEYFNRGRAYSEKGDYDKSLADYNETIRLDPTNSAAFYDRGLIYQRRGDKARAMADFDAALRLQPDLVAALITRGGQHLHDAQFDLAFQDFDQAVRLAPNQFKPYLGRALALGSKGDRSGAIRDLDQALRLDPSQAEVLDSRARFRWQAKQYDLALSDLSEAVKLAPNNADLWLHRGGVEAARFDWDAAISDYGHALALKPGDPKILSARNNAYKLQRLLGQKRVGTRTKDSPP